MKLGKQFFFLLPLLGAVEVCAQQLPVASGGNASGTGGSAAYSYGQVFDAFSTGTSGSINQGVQQPYEIYAVGIPEGSLTMISVFPNPSTDGVTLLAGGYAGEPLTYELTDAQGKLLESKQFNEKTVINMASRAAGSYFLIVRQQEMLIRTFELIKH